MKPHLILLLFLTMPLTAAAPEQKVPLPVFARSIDFSPVRMSYSELYRMLSRARQLIDKANADSDRKYEMESLKLGADATSVELPKGFLESDLQSAPEMTTDVYYNYRLGNGVIQEVTLRLGDSYRSLSTSGTSLSQVDAIVTLMREDMSRQEGGFGGRTFRSSSGLVL
jgi:hypothetical protein